MLNMTAENSKHTIKMARNLKPSFMAALLTQWFRLFQNAAIVCELG